MFFINQLSRKAYNIIEVLTLNEILKIDHLKKSYYTKKGEIEAIKDISFDVNKNEIISIIGPSGSGKSTILNIISNLDKDCEGTITKETNKIAYMLQQDVLLPWLTILENATLGLKITKNLTKENIKYVENLLIKFGLKDFINKKPNELSGGMRQRVALIRTLSLKPDIILLDEPLSALDYVTKLTIIDEMYTILKELKIATILITHDISESISFSDKVIIISPRPSIVKKIININIDNNLPSKKRINSKFNTYYTEIWEALDK